MSRWDGIEEFIAVATAGSFTRASKAIGMSPTHVSRAIIALEQRVQTQLFHRTTRTVRLTDTGSVFLEHCVRFTQERDEAIALIGEQGDPQGVLKVTCSTAMGERFVAPIIRRFSSLHPKLNVTIDLTNRVVDILADGYDLAIRTGHVADSRLMATKVASRTLYTCASPGYLARAGRPALIKELAGHDCIVGTSSTWQFSVDGRDVSYRPKGRFRCNSGHAVVEACLSGTGICQLPDFYILPYLQRGTLELIMDRFQHDDEPIWAVYSKRRHLLPKIRGVVDCLERELEPALRSSV